MRFFFICLLVFSSCFSCSEKNTKWKEERHAIIFFGTKTKDEKFTLKFSEKEASLNYKYVSQIDSSKTISIQKVEDSNSLFFGYEKFVNINKKSFTCRKLNDLKFEFYNSETPLVDGTEILYNEKYGLLAISNGYGPAIVFLKEKDNMLVEQVINKLNN